MEALKVFAIYVTPFLIIGVVIKLLMNHHGVDLSDVQKTAGSKPTRRFLICALPGFMTKDSLIMVYDPTP